MLAELKIFVDDTFTPEIVTTIERAFTTFETLSVEDFELPYLAIVMEEQTSDSLSPQDRFYKQLQQDCNFVLMQFEIKLSDTAQLHDTVELLEALTLIENYENKQELIDAIEASDDSIDALAQVINILSSVKISTIYSIVDEVSPNLINVIKNLGKNKEEELIFEPDQALIKNIKSFKKYLADNGAIGIDLVRNGQPIGADFSYYLKLMNVEFFKNKNYLLLAKDILSLLFISGDAFSNPIEFFRKNSALMFDDLTTITKVDNELTKIVNHYLSEIAGVKNA